MTSTKKPSKDSREKRLRELGETLKALTPQQRAEATRIAARLLEKRAKSLPPKKG